MSFTGSKSKKRFTSSYVAVMLIKGRKAKWNKERKGERKRKRKRRKPLKKLVNISRSLLRTPTSRSGCSQGGPSPKILFAVWTDDITHTRKI